eukprot:2170754-Rhodomonas_salina.1
MPGKCGTAGFFRVALSACVFCAARVKSSALACWLCAGFVGVCRISAAAGVCRISSVADSGRTAVT